MNKCRDGLDPKCPRHAFNLQIRDGTGTLFCRRNTSLGNFESEFQIRWTLKRNQRRAYIMKNCLTAVLWQSWASNWSIRDSWVILNIDFFVSAGQQIDLKIRDWAGILLITSVIGIRFKFLRSWLLDDWKIKEHDLVEVLRYIIIGR